MRIHPRIPAGKRVKIDTPPKAHHELSPVQKRINQHERTQRIADITQDAPRTRTPPSRQRQEIDRRAHHKNRQNHGMMEPTDRRDKHRHKNRQRDLRQIEVVLLHLPQGVPHHRN